MRPKTQYAQSGEVYVAYQVFGEGPPDLVVTATSNIEWGWEQPQLAEFLRALSSCARVILFDRRGSGASDRSGGMPTLEDRMDDVRAVMDAAESERAALYAAWGTAATTALFAATHPQRVLALVLWVPQVRGSWAPDYPWGPRQPPRHLPDMLFAAREQADIGPAELQPDADRLALADDDVGAHLARRLDQPQRDRLGHHRDQQCPRSVRRLGDRREVGDAAKDVGILHDHRAGILVDAGDQPLGIALRGQLGRRDCKRVAGELGHRLAHRDIMRVKARRQDRLGAARDDRRKNRCPTGRIGSKRNCHRAAAQYDAFTTAGTTGYGGDIQDFEREIDS